MLHTTCIFSALPERTCIVCLTSGVAIIITTIVIEINNNDSNNYSNAKTRNWYVEPSNFKNVPRGRHLD